MRYLSEKSHKWNLIIFVKGVNGSGCEMVKAKMNGSAKTNEMWKRDPVNGETLETLDLETLDLETLERKL